ncbi:MAG: hypothetical protein H7844_00765 [Nitrospirae bacterium YQR-1]
MTKCKEQFYGLWRAHYDRPQLCTLYAGFFATGIDSSRSWFINKMKANLQSEVNTGGNEERDALDIQELLTKPTKLDH